VGRANAIRQLDAPRRFVSRAEVLRFLLRLRSGLRVIVFAALRANAVDRLLVAAKNRGYLARKDGGEWLTVGVDIERGRLRPLEV